MSEKKNVSMAAPWAIFYKRLCQLFRYDSDITVYLTEEEPYKINILVESKDKYNALMQLMPSEKEFGNVKVQINVVPSNGKKTDRDLFEILFKDNDALEAIIPRKLPAGDEIYYLMFAPKVVQYYADNLMDPYGNNNDLYADIAREVFGVRDGIQYGTNLVDD